MTRAAVTVGAVDRAVPRLIGNVLLAVLFLPSVLLIACGVLRLVRDKCGADAFYLLAVGGLGVAAATATHINATRIEAEKSEPNPAVSAEDWALMHGSAQQRHAEQHALRDVRPAVALAVYVLSACAILPSIFACEADVPLAWIGLRSFHAILGLQLCALPVAVSFVLCRGIVNNDGGEGAPLSVAVD